MLLLYFVVLNLLVVLNSYYLQIQELLYIKFHKTLFSPFLLRTHYWGFHTREFRHAMWNIWHALVCSKYSISPLSSKNNLKKGTLQITYLFSKYNKKGHSKALFISCCIIVKKVGSNFKKTWLHQKICYNIVLMSI